MFNLANESEQIKAKQKLERLIVGKKTIEI